MVRKKSTNHLKEAGLKNTHCVHTETPLSSLHQGTSWLWLGSSGGRRSTGDIGCPQRGTSAGRSCAARSRAGTGLLADSTACLGQAFIDAFFVLSVAEVDLEVVNCHGWPGGVELSGAVVTADAREILVLDLLVWLEVVGVGHGCECLGVHG